ncbi:MAG: hypothetical protein HZC41_08715 [Chloroflexi bacterium]|nr:hypothetical protein [Chloroflexota bacterium]
MLLSDQAPTAPALQANAPAAARFIRAQVVNAARNANALRPFRLDEFGTAAGSPSPAHIAAANRLVDTLQAPLLRTVERLAAVAAASLPATAQTLEKLLLYSERAERRVKLIEKIWAFYLELFGQRQTRFAPMLLAADRIALDAYQCIYVGLGVPRSIPSPAPFSYMETGFTPATFRRGIALSRLGRQMNPFPIISLPYHRLVNPWTLGAVPHEVSHNLQHDLGLWDDVPRRLSRRLLEAGLAAPVAATWARWHKEIWADLCGLLLSGPAVVASLLDVVARTPFSTTAFNPAGVHPTSYLRVLINLELLRRMDFPAQAAAFEQLWRRLYPDPSLGGIPPAMLASFPRACEVVVDTICFQPYPQLGGRALADVSRFRPDHHRMAEEAAARLAQGTDPGIIPARFLIGAVRLAFDRRLAAPEVIARHFYRALVQR